MSDSYIKAMEARLSEGDKRRLQRIFAPVEVAKIPTNAWKDLCVLPDGELRYYGHDAGGRLYLHSTDAGLSWKAVDVDDMSALCAAVRCPWSGRWIDSYWMAGEGGFQGSEMPLPKAPLEGWQAVLSDEGPGGAVRHVRISDREIRCPRAPLALRSRRRVLICAQAPLDPPRPVVAFTDDDGETWRTVELKPAPKHEIAWPHKGVRWQNGACEATILEREDGSLLMLARTSQDVHYQYESFDGGETWTDPAPSPLHGTLTMPTLLRLESGAALAFFCNTQPLPEQDMSAVWPPLKPSEIEGKGEDVFTNRDANHAAITFDGGKTWRGLRELVLSPVRNEADFRTRGGSDDVLDKSVHQFQALELPYGKVLLAYGQHEVCRRMLIFDPQWLLETTREEDLHEGLIHLSTHVYYKSVSGNRRTRSGHCAWNRTSGAVLLPDPDGNYEEALYLRANADERLVSPVQGVVWNFPAAHKGEVTVLTRPGGEGLHVTLSDRWFNPIDTTAGLLSPYHIAVSADQTNRQGWNELVLRWDEQRCAVLLNSVQLAELAASAAFPNGLSYLILQSAFEPSVKSGSWIKKMRMKSL